jgi:hypothetical protein
LLVARTTGFLLVLQASILQVIALAGASSPLNERLSGLWLLWQSESGHAWLGICISQWLIFLCYPYVTRRVARGIAWTKVALDVPVESGARFVVTTREPTSRWRAIPLAVVVIAGLFGLLVWFLGGPVLFLLMTTFVTLTLPIWCLFEEIRTWRALDVVEVRGFDSDVRVDTGIDDVVAAARRGLPGRVLPTQRGPVWDPFGGYPRGALLLASDPIGKQAMIEAGLP